MSNQHDKQELHERLIAAASGDEVAWRWIVDAYAHRVFALIRSKCANEWPDDYQMRNYCEEQQLKAIRELNR